MWVTSALIIVTTLALYMGIEPDDEQERKLLALAVIIILILSIYLGAIWQLSA